jgi:hypothetical protein
MEEYSPDIRLAGYWRSGAQPCPQMIQRVVVV